MGVFFITVFFLRESSSQHNKGPNQKVNLNFVQGKPESRRDRADKHGVVRGKTGINVGVVLAEDLSKISIKHEHTCVEMY